MFAENAAEDDTKQPTYQGNSSGTALAFPGLVSFVNESHNRQTSHHHYHFHNTFTPTQTPVCPSPVAQTKVDYCQDIKHIYTQQGFSGPVADVMWDSCAPSTYKQYETYWKKWDQFMVQRGAGPHDLTLGLCLDFLEQYRSEKEVGFSAMNSAHAALSLIISVNGKPFGSHPSVTKYFAGVLRRSPHLPKYQYVWDPAMVLNYYAAQADNQELTLKLLTQKTLMLMLLASGQRVQTMSHVLIDNIIFLDQAVKITISSQLKHTKKAGLLLDLQAFPKHKKLCPVASLHSYMEATKHIRQDNALFVCYIKPFGPASKATLSRWVKESLQSAGVNTTIFQAHSVRSAAGSAAKKGGLPLTQY